MTAENVSTAVESVASLCLAHMTAAGVVAGEKEKKFASRVATETLFWLTKRSQGNPAAIAALDYVLNAAATTERAIGGQGKT